MEAVCCSETSEHLTTTLCRNPKEDCHLISNCRENLRTSVSRYCHNVTICCVVTNLCRRSILICTVWKLCHTSSLNPLILCTFWEQFIIVF
jgi:hypothetical protein